MKSPRPKPDTEPTEETKERILDFAKFKSFNSNGKLFYRLELISKVAKMNQKFKLSIGTDSSRDFISIVDTSQGEFQNNILILDIEKGTNVIEKIELDSPFLVAPTLTSINE